MLTSSFNYLKKHAAYLCGLAFVILVTLSIMLAFFNKSLTLVEGWYTFYADYIIKDGLVPYRDFSVIVPPFALAVWTGIQALFGSEYIVFRVADIVIKILIGISFYHLFTKFFSIKIAALAAILTQVVLCSVVFDNGVPSYTEYQLLFMALIANAMLAFLVHLQRQKTLNYRQLCWIGILYTFAFLNKQTSGPLMIIASVGLLMLLIYKKLDFKSCVRAFLTLFVSSMAALLICWSYFIYHGALWDYIQNVFLSYSAKGSAADIFMRTLKVIFFYQWIRTMLVAVIAGFIFYILNRKNIFPSTRTPSLLTTKKGILPFFLMAGAAFVLTYAAAAVSTYHYILKGKDIVNRFGNNINQLMLAGAFCALFVFIYYAIDFLCKKDTSYKNFKLLIVLSLMAAVAYSHSMSYGFPNGYPFIAAFMLAYALNVTTVFNRFKNIFLCGCVVLCVFWGVSMKLQTPSEFHGWRSSNVLEPMEYTKIPMLKGIKLALPEKAFFENIYDKVQRYTGPQDEILAFNNNQVFYTLLERLPYTRYLSYYYDVSPDEESLNTIEMLRQNPPKVVVFLKFAPASEYFHEQIFRDGQPSGQRLLGKYLTELTEKGVYRIEDSYLGQQKILRPDTPKAQQKAFQRFTQLWAEKEYITQQFLYEIMSRKPIFIKRLDELNTEMSSIYEEVKPYLIKKNQFIQDGFEMQLLVRTDVYEQFHNPGRYKKTVLPHAINSSAKTAGSRTQSSVSAHN